MKKEKRLIGGFILLFVFMFLATGCVSKKATPVDVLSEDENYHYYNEIFEITLPKDFEYYQVQRIATNNFLDFEFLVPTTDANYPTEFGIYVKTFVIRIFDKNIWEETKGDYEKNYQILNEKNNKVYTIKTWSNMPKDWDEKWTEDMENNIINSFKLK